MTHIAVIPARAGSVGFPGKNRLFFGNTADFIEGVDWFGQVIVSTDDAEVEAKATARGYDIHERPAELAGGTISIKAVFENLVPAMAIPDDAWLWLLYLPVLYRDRADFDAARTLAEGGGCDSLCTFVPAKTHPYDCWRCDAEAGTVRQFITNDTFRRQDKPIAWQHYHYVCAFRAGALPGLNSELLGPDTNPILLGAAKAANLIEVDTPEDWQRWQEHMAQMAAGR